jgi:hypothetical protein
MPTTPTKAQLKRTGKGASRRQTATSSVDEEETPQLSVGEAKVTGSQIAGERKRTTGSERKTERERQATDSNDFLHGALDNPIKSFEEAGEMDMSMMGVLQRSDLLIEEKDDISGFLELLTLLYYIC